MGQSHRWTDHETCSEIIAMHSYLMIKETRSRVAVRLSPFQHFRHPKNVAGSDTFSNKTKNLVLEDGQMLYEVDVHPNV